MKSNDEFKRSALATAIWLAIVACANAQAKDVEFTGIDVPFSPPETTEVVASPEVTVNGKPQTLVYNELFRTGFTDTNGEVYGLMKDYWGDPAVSGTGVPYVCSGNTPGVEGSGTDFNAIIKKNGKIYLISQFECQTGGMYFAELQQSKKGELTPVPGTLQFIDQSKERGGWVHCAGSVSPWNTYIGGEEYEPNAAALEDQPYPTSDDYYNDKVRSYFGGDISLSSPYQNGWITETDIKKGEATYTKRYALGRFAHELGYVMPDARTVYLTDDGTNETLFMFVADEAGDLSSGNLYAAIWDQVSGTDAGYANLKWINLGHADEAKIRAAVADGTKFSDMFEKGVPGSGCTNISTNDVFECIKLKDDADKEVASRLEARRYAALMGATYEFRKMEGFTYDPKRNRGYIAISELGRGMLDNQLDAERVYEGSSDRNYDDRNGDGIPETGNHVRIDNPDYCGAVYSMDMSAGTYDTDGSPIPSDLVATNMNTLVASGTEKGKLSADECATQNDVIAQPDNVTMMPTTDVLVIGEDGGHANNMVWAYNLLSGEKTRIATVPEGAETTSPYFHKVNQYTYMTLVAQHPDLSADNPDGETITGYVGPITKLGKK